MSSPTLSVAFGSSDSAPLEICNPAQLDDVVGVFAPTSVSVVEELARSAQHASRGWRQLSASNRHARLLEGLDGVNALQGIASLLTRETGKTFAESSGEVSFLNFLVHASQASLDWIQNPVPRPTDGKDHSWIIHKPYGVVGAIVPYNYPVLLAALKVVPALLTGNCVVLALPPTAPLAAGTVYRTLAAALPEGVLSVVAGPGATVGDALVISRSVDKISFTGSTRTGRLIAAGAAQTIKGLTLELGGNDPAIVLEDKTLDDAFFESLVGAAYTAAGQVCFGVKRVYAPHDMIDTIADGIGAVLDSYRVGNGLESGTSMGPLHTSTQRDFVDGLVERAVAEGARVTTHGEMTAEPDQGWFKLPQVVVASRPDHTLVTEEQFGPALPLVGYQSIDEAIKLANDSPYGLASSVWSEDIDRALSVAQQIDAGATFVNNHGLFAMDPRPGLGGFRQSGIGGEGGQASLDSFTQQQVVTRTPSI